MDLHTSIHPPPPRSFVHRPTTLHVHCLHKSYWPAPFRLQNIVALQFLTFQRIIFFGFSMTDESPTFISFLTLRSGRHICLQTFAWHIFLARSSRTRTQRWLEMLRNVAHKQLARTSLRSTSPLGKTQHLTHHPGETWFTRAPSTRKLNDPRPPKKTASHSPVSDMWLGLPCPHRSHQPSADTPLNVLKCRLTWSYSYSNRLTTP